MLTFINERSFPLNLTSENEVFEALEQMVLMAPHAQSIANNQLIRRHRDLHNREILPDMSLREFIACIGKHKNRKFADRSAAFLRMFSRGPFVDSRHTEDDESIAGEDGECLKNSCFDEASSYVLGAALLSFRHNSDEPEKVVVKSSKYGTRVMPEFSSVKAIENFKWIYESNPKHEIKADKKVNGLLHSAMSLDNQTAQFVLTNGVKYGRCVYSLHNEQWYKFHCHERNKYHGFPISDREHYADIVAARKLFGIQPNREGQILGDESWHSPAILI